MNRLKDSTHAEYSKRLLENRKKILLDRLPVGCYSFLDLGCGAGRYMPLLAKRGKHIVGLDLSRELCRLSKRLRFEVIMGDAMHLPFKNSAFDIIWASEVLEHLPSLRIFDELERVAKKWIVATMPNPTIGGNYRADSSHRLNYTVLRLDECFKNRNNWSYVIKGLGVEWLTAAKGLRLPRFFRLLSFYLTFHIPWIAPTFGVIGHKITCSN